MFLKDFRCHFPLASLSGTRHDAPRFEGGRLHSAYGSSGRQNEDSRERHAETPGTGYHQTHRRRVVRRASRRRVLGPGPPRLRHQGLSLGPEEIRRPVARPRRVEEGDAWTARETHRRRGAAPGGGGHRPHQAGRGPDSPSAGARADDGCSRRALHARLRALALQGVERGGLPAGARQPHPAGAGRDACGRGRARAGDGTALRDARRALCGERGAEDRGQGAVAGRRMGPAGARAEPMPGGAQVPDAPA